MTIDAHQHFWRYDPVRDGWITDAMSRLKRDFLPEDFEGECKANGIDGSIAVQADRSEAETLFLLDLAKERESILGVVGWVDLLSASVGERLQFFSQFRKLSGFRHIAQGGNRTISFSWATILRGEFLNCASLATRTIFSFIRNSFLRRLNWLRGFPNSLSSWTIWPSH